MGTPDKMVVCPVCGKEFRRSAKQRKFCSVECRNAEGGSSKKKKAEAEPKPVAEEASAPKPARPARARRGSGEWKRHPRRCTVCGREFFPEKGGQKICSDSCRKESQLLLQGSSVKEEPKEDRIPKGAQCETCWRLRRFWDFQELCTLTMQPPKKPCSLWRGSVLYSEDKSSQEDDDKERD